MRPQFLDGVVSFSGFVLNGGTAFNNTDNFFITPAWGSMRFAKPLVPGVTYVAQVRMLPDGAHAFAGDVYILQDSEIVGVVEAIKYQQWPRVMLNRLFRPPDAMAKTATAAMPDKAHVRGPSLSTSPVAVTTPSRPSQSSNDQGSPPVIATPPSQRMQSKYQRLLRLVLRKHPIRFLALSSSLPGN
ncbi:hypothetical protein F5Y07DRAFT_306266 [Xylaria sp. FL0933]|nr:hypothetical protein F5Y07DRAFT_306266 [Xylaria sp. FL0933]